MALLDNRPSAGLPSSGRWASAALAVVYLVTSVAMESSTVAGVFRRKGVPYALDIWAPKDGLPGSVVFTMVQTRQGYLWLGTQKGLVRFDGHQFTVLDTFNTPGLPSSKILTLFEDSRSNLWVGTEASGAALIRNGGVFPLDFGRGSRESRVIAICEDTDGAVWMLGADGQLARHRDGQFDVWNLGEGSNSVRSAIADSGGGLWIGGVRRLRKVGSTEGLPRKELPIEQELPLPPLEAGLELLRPASAGGHWQVAGSRVLLRGNDGAVRDFGRREWTWGKASAICEDAVGNPVIGTLGEGVYWYDEEGGVTRLSREQGLPTDYVFSLLLDREENLWVGTDGKGLVRVKRLDFDVVERTRDEVVQSVCEGSEGAVWIGYNKGELGVDCWQNGAVKRITVRQGGLDLSIRAILAARDGTVWAGTWSGLFRLTDGAFTRPAGWEQLPPRIHALHEDAEGRLWVGTASGLARKDASGWTILTTNDGLSSSFVRALADDPNGGLWIGTEGGGVCHWNDGDCESWGQDDGVPSDKVASIWVDDRGVVWVGTPSRGLGRFDGQRWTHCTTRNGLASNSLSYLLGDSQANLWIGSNVGIMRVALAELDSLVENPQGQIELRVYGFPDGLPTPECTEGSQPGAWMGREGRLWFSTADGLATVDLQLLKPNPHPPPVVIEAVEIDGISQRTNSVQRSWPQPIIVPPGRERIEIRYTSLNLRAPDRASFRYRMGKYEAHWTEAGDSRVARYPKLPPDEYQFEVQASNEDGVWNLVGATLNLVVKPPFWRTWWFLSSSAGALLAAIVGLVYFLSTQRLQRQVERLREQQALERERARIARDLHDQLGASLTQISLLGEMAEADKALPGEVEVHARQITQTSRDTTRVLDEIVWAVNPSNDTLDGLVTYFCKNAQEYLAVAGIRVRLEVPANLPALELPPEVRHNLFLAAKEAITNIVRHAQASEARIRLRLDSGRFTLEIEDDGRGLGDLDPEKAARRNGVRNMRRRMEDIGGEFALENASGGGVVVRLTAPYRTSTSR